MFYHLRFALYLWNNTNMNFHDCWFYPFDPLEGDGDPIQAAIRAMVRIMFEPLEHP